MSMPPPDRNHTSPAPRFATDADTPALGVPTLTGWERRIRERATHLSRGQVQRLALRAYKAGIPYEGAWRWITYADPTGDLAVAHSNSGEFR